MKLDKTSSKLAHYNQEKNSELQPEPQPIFDRSLQDKDLDEVFNLEVDAEHCYAGGTNSVVVHNSNNYGDGPPNVAPNSVPRVKFTKEMLPSSEVIAKVPQFGRLKNWYRLLGERRKAGPRRKGWDMAGNEWHWYEHHGIGRKGVKLAGENDPF